MIYYKSRINLATIDVTSVDILHIIIYYFPLADNRRWIPNLNLLDWRSVASKWLRNTNYGICQQRKRWNNMGMWCPDCEMSAWGERFCSECGKKVVPMPRCNWCNYELDPWEYFCPRCGRSRHQALNTVPPPPPPKETWWNRIKRMFGQKKEG